MPISPNRNRILLLGILIGLAVPGTVFLMILFMDTRIHSRKDLMGVVSVPFLGEIPFDKDAYKQQKKQKTKSVLVKENVPLGKEDYR